MSRWTLLLIALCGAMQAPSSPAQETLSITMTIDLSVDDGRPMGSLWEATDALGRPMAGAGFQTAYNTQDRTDRRLVHVYVRPDVEDKWTLQPMPRPTTDAGVYLFGFNNKLFAKGRSSYMDSHLRVWKPTEKQWQITKDTVPFSVHLAGGVLAQTGNSITFNDDAILTLDDNEGRAGEWYYSFGHLIVRRFHSQTTPPENELIAFAWKPGEGPIRREDGLSTVLSHPTEFVYSFGAMNGSVLTASNRGGVHAFDGQRWTAVRIPDGKSFQIYSAMNMEDRLVLGQYPSGELLEYSDGQLKPLKGSPPVMTGVQSRARELQSLALYGGDIYAGVWPWGEVWRRNMHSRTWEFAGRTFRHPEPTDRTTHPWEEETKALDAVANRWGQRVTSLIPHGDSLYLSTSAKTSQPFEARFAFLGNQKHLEYGAVYRYQRPGCLAVPVQWKGQPFELKFDITETDIEVNQDGRSIGRTTWDRHMPAHVSKLHVTKGTGIYGLFGGRILGFNKTTQ